jgi:dodecin
MSGEYQKKNAQKHSRANLSGVTCVCEGIRSRPAKNVGRQSREAMAIIRNRDSERADGVLRSTHLEKTEELAMSESVYKVIEIIGTSKNSWEDAAKVAVERASKTLRDLRVAEIVHQDLIIEDGKVEAYRTKLSVSFKYAD